MVKAIVIGFPKSGTSTIYHAAVKAGVRSVHWTHEGKPVGRLVYDGWFDQGDPLAHFQGVDLITQLDYCGYGRQENYWPNLDIALLTAIRARYPDCIFILNVRAPEKIANSIERWGDLQDRITRRDIPGLPAGRGRTPDELVRWITGHCDAVRRIFRGDPAFLELDITAPDAPALLGRALGVEITWWGVANSNPNPSPHPLLRRAKPIAKRVLDRLRPG